jgi:hypothetical protein
MGRARSSLAVIALALLTITCATRTWTTREKDVGAPELVELGVVDHAVTGEFSSDAGAITLHLQVGEVTAIEERQDWVNYLEGRYTEDAHEIGNRWLLAGACVAVTPSLLVQATGSGDLQVAAIFVGAGLGAPIMLVGAGVHMAPLLPARRKARIRGTRKTELWRHPVPAANVGVSLEADGQILGEGVTDSSGTLSIRFLPPETASVIVSVEDGFTSVPFSPVGVAAWQAEAGLERPSHLSRPSTSEPAEQGADQ